MIWALVDLRGKFNYTTIQAVNKAVGFCQLPQLSSLFFFTNSSHATKLYTEENENQENLVFLFSFLEAAHDERTKSRNSESRLFFGVHVQGYFSNSGGNILGRIVGMYL